MEGFTGVISLTRSSNGTTSEENESLLVISEIVENSFSVNRLEVTPADVIEGKVLASQPSCWVSLGLLNRSAVT